MQSQSEDYMYYFSDGVIFILHMHWLNRPSVLHQYFLEGIGPTAVFGCFGHFRVLKQISFYDGQNSAA